jgi:hypothetical protein
MSALIGTLFFPLLLLLFFRDDDAASTALFSSLITPQPTTTTNNNNNNNKNNRNWINSSSKHTEILPSSLTTAILPQIAIHDLRHGINISLRRWDSSSNYHVAAASVAATTP